jgi:hypothetical protein
MQKRYFFGPNTFKVKNCLIFNNIFSGIQNLLVCNLLI